MSPGEKITTVCAGIWIAFFVWLICEVFASLCDAFK